MICALLVFLAPHHRRKAELFKPTTLAEVYREMFQEGAGDLNSRGIIWLGLAGAAGVWASFFPVIFVGMTRLWPPAEAPVIYVMAGIVTALGVAANLVVMLVSHMSFGFGRSNSSLGETAFIWIIPVFQILFGVASCIAGCSGRAASLLNEWIN